jgi:hypothetical protein
MLVVGGVVLNMIERSPDRPVEVTAGSRSPEPGGPLDPPSGSTSSTTSEAAVDPESTTTTTPAMVSSSTTRPSGPVSSTTSTARRATPTSTRPTTTTTAAVASNEVATVGRGLHIVRPDGSGLRVLASDAWGAVFAPDGQHVAFVDGDQNLWVTDLAGRATKVASRFRNGRVTPTWSPDSKALAYPGDGLHISERDVWIVPADGSGPARPIRDPGDDAVVSWSSTGRLASANGDGISTFDPDGSNRTLVYATNLTNNPGPMSWSPQGTHLASFPDTVGYWFTVAADGSDVRMHDDNRIRFREARWAPSGRELAAGSIVFKPRQPTDPREVDHQALVRFPLDGDPVEVGRDLDHAVWSPSGDRLAAVTLHASGGGIALVTMAPSGDDRRVVLDLHGLGVQRLDWSGRSDWIAIVVG